MTQETFVLVLELCGIAAITARIMAFITYIDTPKRRRRK